MGSSCGCARRNSHILNCSEPTSGRSHPSHMSPHALQSLKEYYIAAGPLIPRKLRGYYAKVIDGAYMDVSEVVVRVMPLKGRQVDMVLRLLPFFMDLRVLRLWKVGGDGAFRGGIAPALDSLSDVNIVSLEDNQLNDDTVRALSPKIARWENLRELWLPANDITAAGAKHLAEALQHCHKLAVLSLDANCLCNPGSDIVCKALLNKAPLQLLSLQHNSIDSASASGLESLGRLNPPEKLTTLQGNCFDERDCAILRTEFGAEKVKLQYQRSRSK